MVSYCVEIMAAKTFCTVKQGPLIAIKPPLRMYAIRSPEKDTVKILHRLQMAAFRQIVAERRAQVRPVEHYRDFKTDVYILRQLKTL